MLEDHLTQAITNDSLLRARFPATSGLRPPEEWWFAASAVGIGPNVADPPTPWMAWNELPSNPFKVVSETSNAQTRAFTIYGYGKRGDPSILMDVMRDVTRIVKAMPIPFTLLDGTRCSGLDWDGISGILPADAYDGICRFGTVRFVVSQ